MYTCGLPEKFIDQPRYSYVTKWGLFFNIVPLVVNTLLPLVLLYLDSICQKCHKSQPFPRVLAWNETQTATSRIWTWVVNSISYKNNNYAKYASGELNVTSWLDNPSHSCPLGWGCRIHWLHLYREVRPPPHESPGYDTKQCDGEVPVMLEL